MARSMARSRPPHGKPDARLPSIDLTTYPAFPSLPAWGRAVLRTRAPEANGFWSCAPCTTSAADAVC